MKTQKKTVPTFSSEQEEREFWATHDSSEYIDWENAKPAIFPNLKPTMKRHIKASVDSENQPKKHKAQTTNF
ncbi:MAG: hypothetical protein HGB15_07115 [Chlorobaculum sp.]|nr:hypothetical protein [Chlorobaculum sp.]